MGVTPRLDRMKAKSCGKLTLVNLLIKKLTTYETYKNGTCNCGAGLSYGM